MGSWGGGAGGRGRWRGRGKGRDGRSEARLGSARRPGPPLFLASVAPVASVAQVAWPGPLRPGGARDVFSRTGRPGVAPRPRPLLRGEWPHDPTAEAPRLGPLPKTPCRQKAATVAAPAGRRLLSSAPPRDSAGGSDCRTERGAECKRRRLRRPVPGGEGAAGGWS